MIEYLVDECGLGNVAVLTGAGLAVAVWVFVDVMGWVIEKVFGK